LRTAYGDHRRAGCQRHRVEDQHDPPVAKYRGASNTDDPGELGTDVLDHDFLVAKQLVDLYRDPLRTGTE
jgi:hypothetical protein